MTSIQYCPSCGVSGYVEPPLAVGDIVQMNPETVGNKAFAGAMMVVTEVRAWGVQGYVQVLGTRESIGGLAYYRAQFDEFKRTGGKAVWAMEALLDRYLDLTHRHDVLLAEVERLRSAREALDKIAHQPLGYGMSFEEAFAVVVGIARQALSPEARDE